MEKSQPKKVAVDNFIVNWNVEFPDHQLTVADLKNPHVLIGALFEVFNRLGIDRDAVLMPPPESEQDDHTIYYWDLLPVINMTRIFNHLVSLLHQEDNLSISITHLLQPNTTTSFSILLLPFNFMIFNEAQMDQIAPHEKELFAMKEQVKMLEDRKNRLVEMLNEQAIQKVKRAERLQILDHEIKQYEEELKHEKEVHDEAKQELDAVVEENRQMEVLLEQKKGHRDGLVAEVARKRAMRVYDAEDIRAQAEQAAQSVQEAEEKLASLEATLKQKENSLKNLQTIKPNLDTANTLLHEIMKLAESLRDYETGDLESDSKEGELEMMQTELGELRAALGETRAARADGAAGNADAAARRRAHRADLTTALREAEENDRKCQERSKKALQRVQEIKEQTVKYEEEKAKSIEELANIKTEFTNEMKTFEEALLNKLSEVESRIEDKLRNRHR